MLSIIIVAELLSPRGWDISTSSSALASDEDEEGDECSEGTMPRPALFLSSDRARIWRGGDRLWSAWSGRLEKGPRLALPDENGEGAEESPEDDDAEDGGLDDEEEEEEVDEDDGGGTVLEEDEEEEEEEGEEGSWGREEKRCWNWR